MPEAGWVISARVPEPPSRFVGALEAKPILSVQSSMPTPLKSLEVWAQGFLDSVL